LKFIFSGLLHLTALIIRIAIVVELNTDHKHNYCKQDSICDILPAWVAKVAGKVMRFLGHFSVCQKVTIFPFGDPWHLIVKPQKKRNKRDVSRHCGSYRLDVICVEQQICDKKKIVTFFYVLDCRVFSCFWILSTISCAF